MSIPSRIIANSLARNSTERVPSFKRGNLNTPTSSRLYQRTNPSRSHARMFNRSPRRERKRKGPSLNGSWPITARTRSARRSKPQRMSLASTASQMRGPCVRSSARKLGRPIMVLAPTPPATNADDPRRIRAPQPRCGIEQAELQSPCLVAQFSTRPDAPKAALALPRTAPLPLPAISSSKRTTATTSPRARDKTPPHTAHSRSVRKLARATSPTVQSLVLSYLQGDSQTLTEQDGVYTALTKVQLASLASRIVSPVAKAGCRSWLPSM